MTTEQQILFDMARDNTRLAQEFLKTGAVGFAIQHLKLAQTNLEQFQRLSPSAIATKPVLEIESTTTKSHE